MRLAYSWPALAVAIAPALSHAQDDLHSGGLAPPPPIEGSTSSDSTATEAATTAELEQADRKDSGRGLEFFWVNAEAGVQYLGLETFKSNDVVDSELVGTTQLGPLFGAGVGVRLIFITLGGRFRLANFEDFQLWTLDAEVGLRIPLGALEPYFTFAGGYATLGSFDVLDGADVSVKGLNLRGGFGLDYYVANTFSIGANVAGDLMFLSRGGIDDLDADGDDARAAVYARDGSGIGGGVTLTAVAGLHF